MVAVARRVFVRPKIDEACPAWARPLIPLSEQEHELGIPYDRIPQATLEVLEYFSPIPVPPKRQRRIGGEMPGSRYARTSGLAVFLACLPYAAAKQLDLFADAPGGVAAEVAVLSLRKLADLAKKVGMSYDRVQRWMTILVTLGFIWRFRDGRRTLYVIPLAVYAPRPSAEDVRAKLTALIHSQFYEVEQSDGQMVRADRDPEFTDLLLAIRAKFEERYQLAPSSDLDLIDPSWENTLSDVQKVLPGLTRNDLYAIIPIVARNLLQQSGTRKGRRFVLKRDAIESTFSIETTPEREQTAGTLSAQKSARRTRKVRTIEALPADQDHYQTASTCDSQEVAAHAHGRGRERLDDKSRFNQQDIPATASLHDASQAASGFSGSSAASASNLHLPSAASSTLRSPGLQEGTRQEEHAKAQGSEQEQKEAKERWCKEQGLEIARIFDDQKSLDFYVGVHRVAQDPLLLRAVFIKALYQAQRGGFKGSIGAYFNFMWNKVWGPYRTYDAACAKWQKWGNKRDPKGIPPDIQKLVLLYEYDSYTRIASCMGYAVPQAEQESWLPDGSGTAGVPGQPMTLGEAEGLVGALLQYASWYLRDPQIYQPADVLGPGGYVVGALWPDRQEAVFASLDEWQDLHEQMLTLPEEIDAWFEAERVKHLQEGVSVEDGMSAQEKEECVWVALARHAFYGRNATSLPWEDLVAEGMPLVGKWVEEAIQAKGDLVLMEGQLYVRLSDEDLVPVDEAQRLDALGDRIEWLEDQDYTVEGQLAVLQAGYLLGLHISVLSAFGLSTYRKLVANWQDQAERGAVTGTQEASEVQSSVEVPGEGQAASTSSGMLNAVAWQFLERLTRALDSRFYQIRWRPVGAGTCCIVIASLLSGQTYEYACPAQVEQALAELSLQESEEH